MSSASQDVKVNKVIAPSPNPGLLRGTQSKLETSTAELQREAAAAVLYVKQLQEGLLFTAKVHGTDLFPSPSLFLC